MTRIARSELSEHLAETLNRLAVMAKAKAESEGTLPYLKADPKAG